MKSIAAPRCAHMLESNWRFASKASYPRMIHFTQVESLKLQLHLFEGPGYPGLVGNLLVRMRGLEPPLPCEN